jgi:hypothetical protein
MLTLPLEITIAGCPSKEPVCADANPDTANQNAMRLKLSMEPIIRYNPASVQAELEDHRVTYLHVTGDRGLNCTTPLE